MPRLLAALRFPVWLRLLYPAGLILVLLPALCMADQALPQVAGILIPRAFARALQEGMNIPLSLHLQGASGRGDDQKIGFAAVRLQGQQIIVRFVQLEEPQGNAGASQSVRQQLTTLKDTPFNPQLQLRLSADASLNLDLQQLILQLVVSRTALGTLLRQRSEDIGASGVNRLSSSLKYNLGMYHNQVRRGQNSGSGYLSFNNATALGEHHMLLEGSVYGMANGSRNTSLYKALYERDFSGYRFAAGMLDSWNLQSIGPVTALSAGKIYGLSWGNQARSTVFDNTQSVTPVIVFLPAAGEVYISRQGRLISVQNFSMGNHEIDTRQFPYGLYDVEIIVQVNGKQVSKHTERVNKLFSRDTVPGQPLAWQLWGGALRADRRPVNTRRSSAEKQRWLIGSSGSGSLNLLSWAATGYSYDNNLIGESRLSLPVTDSLAINHQLMLANDQSRSSLSSMSASLPGGFSSVWLNHEITRIGSRLQRSDAHNSAIGSSLNMSMLPLPAGTLSASYNSDRLNNSRYYTADYYQTLFSGTQGTLGVRLGLQRYNNGDSPGGSNKYIAIDFSLQFGQLFSLGLTHQRGYILANLEARQQFDSGFFRSVGANMATVISGDPRGDNRLSGGAYTRFDSRYSGGTLAVNSSAEGNINSSLTAYGSLGWQGRHLAASSNNDDTAGIIVHTELQDNSQLSASINGRAYDLQDGANYLPLPAYGRYDIEIRNNSQSADSYKITRNRKQSLTLYPGNVAVIEPQTELRITVFGRLYRQDGQPLANSLLRSGTQRSFTDSRGEFSMDIDKKNPLIRLDTATPPCQFVPDLQGARGAVWIGDITCRSKESANESP